ncbi:MAG: hypothetical protein JW785_05265, partial [Acidimicrobiia bacterium]|nr:hypothetical protein [Acidimicrobiia bacterium]
MGAHVDDGGDPVKGEDFGHCGESGSTVADGVDRRGHAASGSLHPPFCREIGLAHHILEGGFQEWDSPLYHEALKQFDHVAELMGLDHNVADRLRVPQRALVVTFPFRHDDYADVESVFGYRVQHVLTMGPTKGGIRYAP